VKDEERDFAELLGFHLSRAGYTQQELANTIEMHRNTIVSWLNRSARPSRGHVLRLAEALFLEKDETKAFIRAAGFTVGHWPAEIWFVPRRRDPFFVGRADTLRLLQSRLTPGTLPSQTQAISGLAGIGKTLTAVEYAHRSYRRYEAVLLGCADL